MDSKDELLRRAQEFAQRSGLALGDKLGAGVHGTVFLAENQLRLQAHAVTALRGCEVPQLLRYDDELFVLEMTVVTRPFVLDFAGAYLDRPLDFSTEVMADWHADKVEQFGARWTEVQAILRALESFGIYMEDVNPGNISFLD